MKDIYLPRLQRVADAAARSHEKSRAAGFLGSRAKEDHEALLWAIFNIAAGESLLAHEVKCADELLRLMGLDPAKYRTDGGFLNVGRIKAAWRGKVASMRADAALLISASRRRTDASRSVSAMIADRLAPFSDPVPPAATGRSATRHPLAAEADRLESLGG